MKLILKSLFLIVLLLFSLQTRAQVTIGSDIEPDTNSLLDIKQNAEGTSTKGFLPPRVKLTSTTSYAPMTAHVQGLLVYNLESSEDVTPGYYYNDGTKWIRLGGSTQTWLASATSTPSDSNTENIYHAGSVGIGDNSVDPTAILNISSTDKGILLPRVTLTSPTDIVTIPNPTIGLLVYNTGNNSAFTTLGYMYWNGTEWKLFASASSELASATINCASATLSPSQQIIGDTPIVDGTVIQIPYSLGNGGSYRGATLTSVGNPNIVGTIAEDMLSVGSGVINISLSGTPTVAQQAPAGITFDLTTFLNLNPDITGCNEITVGNVLEATQASAAVMGYLTYTEDNTGNDVGTTGYALQCDSPDGKYSARVRVPSNINTIASGNQYINIQLRNNQSTSQTVIWNYNTIYSGGTVAGANTLTMPSQRWGGNNSDSGGTWYNATASTTGNGGYMGNIGIYDGSGPEYRRYTWIPLGAENNVAYEIYVMAALDTATPSTAVSPTKLKVYIKFDQVTAAK